MTKNVLKPYTKAKAVLILRRYFGLRQKDAEAEVERLSACVVRDGLSAASYLYNWECAVQQGRSGNITELHRLYPYEQAHGGYSVPKR